MSETAEDAAAAVTAAVAQSEREQVKVELAEEAAGAASEAADYAAVAIDEAEVATDVAITSAVIAADAQTTAEVAATATLEVDAASEDRDAILAASLAEAHSKIDALNAKLAEKEAAERQPAVEPVKVREAKGEEDGRTVAGRQRRQQRTGHKFGSNRRG